MFAKSDRKVELSARDELLDRFQDLTRFGVTVGFYL